MGSDGVVDADTPSCEVGGEVVKGVAADGGPEFPDEGAVDAFDFSLGLWVVGAAVERSHAEGSSRASNQETVGTPGLWVPKALSQRMASGRPTSPKTARVGSRPWPWFGWCRVAARR